MPNLAPVHVPLHIYNKLKGMAMQIKQKVKYFAGSKASFNFFANFPVITPSSDQEIYVKLDSSLYNFKT